MVSPVWILWIMREKLTDWGGSALSEATVAALRVEASFSLGLWQSTHISIWLRFSPWRERLGSVHDHRRLVRLGLRRPQPQLQDRAAVAPASLHGGQRRGQL